MCTNQRRKRPERIQYRVTGSFGASLSAVQLAGVRCLISRIKKVPYIRCGIYYGVNIISKVMRRQRANSVMRRIVRGTCPRKGDSSTE